MSNPVEFIVTLAPGASAVEVSAALHGHGFQSTSVLHELSMIVGLADPDNAKAIASVHGVAAVEPSQTITIPPEGPQ